MPAVSFVMCGNPKETIEFCDDFSFACSRCGLNVEVPRPKKVTHEYGWNPVPIYIACPSCKQGYSRGKANAASAAE